MWYILFVIICKYYLCHILNTWMTDCWIIHLYTNNFERRFNVFIVCITVVIKFCSVVCKHNDMCLEHHTHFWLLIRLPLLVFSICFLGKHEMNTGMNFHTFLAMWGKILVTKEKVFFVSRIILIIENAVLDFDYTLS